MRKVIAVDFDGCLCECAWPKIDEPHWPVIHAAQLAQCEGAALILWTCRIGERLNEAVEWCGEHGLVFDAVNDNLPERVAFYQANPRKVNADEYLDDLSVCMPEPPTPCGRWIDKGWDGDFSFRIDGRGNCWRVFECSACGKQSRSPSAYCPHCGAKMMEEQHNDGKEE